MVTWAWPSRCWPGRCRPASQSPSAGPTAGLPTGGWIEGVILGQNRLAALADILRRPDHAGLGIAELRHARRGRHFRRTLDRLRRTAGAKVTLTRQSDTATSDLFIAAPCEMPKEIRGRTLYGRCPPTHWREVPRLCAASQCGDRSGVGAWGKIASAATSSTMSQTEATAALVAAVLIEGSRSMKAELRSSAPIGDPGPAVRPRSWPHRWSCWALPRAWPSSGTTRPACSCCSPASCSPPFSMPARAAWHVSSRCRGAGARVGRARVHVRRRIGYRLGPGPPVRSGPPAAAGDEHPARPPRASISRISASICSARTAGGTCRTSSPIPAACSATSSMPSTAPTSLS